ncbi:MAG: hypothetical protein J6B00_01425 [Alphaproteobacteria bacterium]|nr:hypothetical protein [Alphaproteobacteria bacterium]
MDYNFMQTMTVERMAEYLDYNVGVPYNSRQPLQSFEQMAKQELTGIKEEIVNVYSCYGLVYHTSLSDQGMVLSLTSQDYIASPWVKRFTGCTKLAVFFKKNLLWQVSKFEKGLQPLFLNREQLTEQLQKPFGKVELTLGELSWETLKSIAWQFKTETDQEFVIPWHNAALIEQTPEMVFVAKDFKELRNTYKILKFKELRPREQYAILLA